MTEKNQNQGYSDAQIKREIELLLRNEDSLYPEQNDINFRRAQAIISLQEKGEVPEAEKKPWQVDTIEDGERLFSNLAGSKLDLLEFKSLARDYKDDFTPEEKAYMKYKDLLAEKANRNRNLLMFDVYNPALTHGEGGIDSFYDMLRDGFGKLRPHIMIDNANRGDFYYGRGQQYRHGKPQGYTTDVRVPRWLDAIFSEAFVDKYFGEPTRVDSPVQTQIREGLSAHEPYLGVKRPIEPSSRMIFEDATAAENALEYAKKDSPLVKKYQNLAMETQKPTYVKTKNGFGKEIILRFGTDGAVNRIVYDQ